MSAIRGARGQKLLREMLAALDAMPEKWLVRNELVTDYGEYCALGCVGAARGIKMDHIDPEEPEQVAVAFDIAEPLAREIAFENDENAPDDPQKRWKYMRRWVESHINDFPSAQAVRS
jgi:hypothetical protein